MKVYYEEIGEVLEAHKVDMSKTNIMTSSDVWSDSEEEERLKEETHQDLQDLEDELRERAEKKKFKKRGRKKMFQEKMNVIQGKRYATRSQVKKGDVAARGQEEGE